jgi:single-stranded DNA-binding protein
VSKGMSATIWGHAVADSGLRYTPEGKAVTTFTVGIDQGYYVGEGDEREWKDKSDFIKCVAFGKFAEIVRVSKGQPVVCEGVLKAVLWPAKGEYAASAHLEMILDSYKTMAKPKAEAAPAPDSEPVPDDKDEEEIPF